MGREVTRSDDWNPDQSAWPEWMKRAARDVGVREQLGPGTNPRIAEYYAHTSLGGEPEDDHVAWCSAAVNCWMHEAGYRGTRRANARSWLDWGQQLKQPVLGCVVVFWRGDPLSKLGHVGLFCEMEVLKGHIMVLGGNQGNRVSFQRYPIQRLLGFRWPTEQDRLQPTAAGPLDT